MTKLNISKLTLNILAVAGMIREKIMQKNTGPFSVLELKTLGIVSKNEGISMSKLAECLHVSSPSATEVINKLVKNGELKRSSDEKDRRIISLQITPQGKKILEQSLKLASKNISKLLTNLSSSQKNDFNKILEIIINNKK